VADDTLPTIGTLGGATTDSGPEPDLEARYELGGVLGRGGMGEVRFAHDVRIDREVAIKMLRRDQRDEDTIARFFREAHVQGRLDHPAVVPVHDLGIAGDGSPYFVMKRLTGTTLAEVLHRAATDPPSETWPRRQLLARFVDVCLAIEFAHARGVVHRDLKPGNIMLGDFGEVYVIDWGLARIIGESSRPQRPGAAPIGELGAGQTVAGSLLGTPGYMAPEQMRGETAGPHADVFALGCILFEILAGQPAIAHGRDAFAATLDARDHRPSDWYPELAIPPELDELCARATAADPAARPSARVVADAVQAYLDGDRDLARRIALAARHAEQSRQALAGRGDEARAEAMREAGRALVLDPNNADAQGVLARMMLAAPDQIPAKAMAAADAERSLARQAVLRWIWKGYASLVLIMCVLFAFPILNLPLIVAMIVVTAASGALAFAASRRPLPMRSWLFVAGLLGNAMAIGCASLVFGPLLIVPLFLVLSLAGILSLPTGFPAFVLVIPHALAIAVPLVLEWAGVLPATYHVDGGLVLTPPALVLSRTMTVALMLIAIVTASIMVILLTTSQRAAQERAQNQVHAQTWHLEQLLPEPRDRGGSTSSAWPP
jgi:hypothetical protein